MSTAHSKKTNEDDGGESSSPAVAKKKANKSRSVAITCSLPDTIDDEGADKIREEIGAEVTKYLKKRLGKNVQDLIVH